jgi:beta-galactosidase
MNPVSFDSLCYRLDGRRHYVYSGEFHYFRVPRRDWGKRMRLLKAAGGNALATYIPWMIHEPQEGDFRFSGAKHLALEAFLDKAAEMELHVIARPGPYQYSELAYAGLPGWLCENYPNCSPGTSTEHLCAHTPSPTSTRGSSTRSGDGSTGSVRSSPGTT